MEEASLGRHHGRGIMEEASWRRHEGPTIRRGNTQEASRRKHHGGDIIGEASWKRHHGGGIHLRFSPPCQTVLTLILKSVLLIFIVDSPF